MWRYEMKRILTLLTITAVVLALGAGAAMAGGVKVKVKPPTKKFIYVATAKNLRGALYIGHGPSASHAAEMAIVKCSQDSVIPMTCEVCKMRQEPVTGPLAKAPVKTRGKHISKIPGPVPPAIPWRKPMP
jgi:hypothetical protein